MSKSKGIPRRTIIEVGILVVVAGGIAIGLNWGMMFFLNTSNPQVAVTTFSMVPTYYGFCEGSSQACEDFQGKISPFQGDLLIIQNIPANELRVGDVIVFDVCTDCIPVVHRIILVDEQNDSSVIFKTKGDNNNRPDHWDVDGTAVLGKIILRVPHLGWLNLQLRTLLGRLLIIGIILLLLFQEIISEDNNEEKKDEENNELQSKNEIPATLKKKVISLRRIYRNRYFIATASIILLFFFTNVLQGLEANRALIYRTDGKEIDESAVIISRQTSESLKSYTNGSTIFFWQFNLQMTSHGLFNHIRNVEIKTNQSQLGIYRWTTVYSFSGTKTIKAGVPVMLHPSLEANLELTVIITSSGLLASKIAPQNFQITLKLSS